VIQEEESTPKKQVCFFSTKKERAFQLLATMSSVWVTQAATMPCAISVVLLLCRLATTGARPRMSKLGAAWTRHDHKFPGQNSWPAPDPPHSCVVRVFLVIIFRLGRVFSWFG
jgi:hypothetical protein